jgi:hypothetical protein
MIGKESGNELAVTGTLGIVRKVPYVMQNKLLEYFQRNSKCVRAIVIVMLISFIWLRIKISVRSI